MCEARAYIRKSYTAKEQSSGQDRRWEVSSRAHCFFCITGGRTFAYNDGVQNGVFLSEGDAHFTQRGSCCSRRKLPSQPTKASSFVDCEMVPSQTGALMIFLSARGRSSPCFARSCVSWWSRTAVEDKVDNAPYS